MQDAHDAPSGPRSVPMMDAARAEAQALVAQGRRDGVDEKRQVGVLVSTTLPLVV
jgi:hypothetical protein